MIWPDHGIGPWGYVLMSLNMLVFWGLIAAGIVLVVRYLGRSGPAAGPGSAERILAERYARGEIDEQEYRQRLAVLRGGPPA